MKRELIAHTMTHMPIRLNDINGLLGGFVWVV